MFYQSSNDSVPRINTMPPNETYYMNSASQMASHGISNEEAIDFYHGSSGKSSRTSSTVQESPRDLSGHIDFNPSSPYLYDYLMQPQTREPIHAIPIELGIESLYEDLDRRKKNKLNTTSGSSQVHVRRRAQNRASQRAFRDRKEKHVKEVEARLQDLEGRYSNLSQSYEALQNEYITIKRELNQLIGLEDQYDDVSQNGSLSDSHTVPSESSFGMSKEEGLDSILFSESLYCFGEDGPEAGTQRRAA